MDYVGLCVSHFRTDDAERFPASVTETLAAHGMVAVPVRSDANLREDKMQRLCGILADGWLPHVSVLCQAKNLRAVGSLSAGYDHLPVADLHDAGIACLNAPTAFAWDVAQAAMTLMLGVAGRLTERQLLMRWGATGWREGAALAGTSLRGKTLGVVGPGAIGQALFLLTEPFEFHKLAYGAHIRPEIVGKFGFSYVDLDELCRQSDILVLACPLNAQTRGLMNAERLALLKETAILVNVARGGVIDEGALIKALVENRIAGAGLDVFEDEPTRPDNPLLSMSNVVATPHGLAVTNEGYHAALDEVARGMRAVLDGREAENLVSPAAAKQT